VAGRVEVRELDVTIVNRQRARRISTLALERLIHRLAERIPPGPTASMAVCLVSDRAMERYNREFRGKARTTDVLSFSGEGEPFPEGGRHLGDVVISVPRAIEQARDLGHSPEREVQILLIHGYLHLVGYDHETDDGEMMRLQRRLVRTLLPGTRGATR
jgi:probable rRNA maturation factor